MMRLNVLLSMMRLYCLALFLLSATSDSFAFTSSIQRASRKQSTASRFLKDNDDKEEEDLSATKRVIRYVLDQMRDSPFIEEKHQEHCESTTVTHLFKGTPLVNLPDRYKLDFVDSWAGRALATVMAEEQAHLGHWKIEKILEAAGDYNEEAARRELQDQIESSPILMYSFEDCPWCIAAKALLEEHYNEFPCRIVELEPLGPKGKCIRAELAKQTGRTSLPSIFVNGQPVGGFTDGIPCGPGLQPFHESGGLSELLKGSIQEGKYML
jgi:glutaredoxin 3